MLQRHSRQRLQLFLQFVLVYKLELQYPCMAQLRQFLLESVQRLGLEPEPEPKKKKLKTVYNTSLVLYKTKTKLSNILNLSLYYLFLFQTRTKDFSKFEKAIKKKKFVVEIFLVGK